MQAVLICWASSNGLVRHFVLVAKMASPMFKTKNAQAEVLNIYHTILGFLLPCLESPCKCFIPGYMQVQMQAVILVSVFRKASRKRLMGLVELCLPSRLPFRWKGQEITSSPASLFHNFLEQSIKNFQAGVALRQSPVHPSQR